MDILDAVEVRVLGSLVEKELSTPDYYPMTVNALTAACNQKSNRDPVVNFTEEDVLHGVEGLHRKRLVGTSTYGRATKYRHTLGERFDLDRPRLAVLASLMLRGPETAGEVRGRSGRLFAFDTIEQVQVLLDELSDGEAPLVAALPRLPGQKEQRYAHRFAGEPEADAGPAAALEVRYADDERLLALEDEVAALRDELRALSDAFAAFREQFE